MKPETKNFSSGRAPFAHPQFFIRVCQGPGARAPGPQQKCCRRAKRGEGYSPTLNRGAIALPRRECLVSAKKWRGVGDRLRGERGSRLLTKGGQLPYSGWVNTLPLALPGAMPKRKKLGVGEKGFFIDFIRIPNL